MPLVNTLQIKLDLIGKQFDDGVRVINKRLDELEEKLNNAAAGYQRKKKASEEAEKGMRGLANSLLLFIRRGPSVGGAIRIIIDAVKKMNVVMALGLTVATALTFGFQKLTQRAIDLGAALFDMSRRTGLSTTFLAKLKVAAEQNDVSLQDVQLGMKFLNRQLALVASGSQAAAKNFKTLGVNVRDANGAILPAEKVVLRIGDALSKYSDEGIRAGKASLVYGRAAQEVVPLLGKSGAELEKELGLAEKLGLKIGEDFPRQSDEFKNSLARLQIALLGIGVNIAEDLLPSLIKLTNGIVALTVGFGKLGDAGPKIRRFFGDLEGAIESVGNRIPGMQWLNALIARNRESFGTAADPFTIRALDIARGLDKVIETVALSLEDLAALMDASFRKLTGQAEAAADPFIQIAEKMADLGTVGVPALQKLVSGLEALNKVGGEFAGQLDDAIKKTRELLDLAARGPQIPASEIERAAGRVPGFRAQPLDIRAPEAQPTTTVLGQQVPTEGAQILGTVNAEPLPVPDLEPAMEQGIRIRDIFGEIGIVGESAFEAINGAANTFADTIISAATGAKDAFANLFKQILRDIAKAIVRALILRVIMSVSGIGAIAGTIGKFLNPKGAFGQQDAGDVSLMGPAQQARRLNLSSLEPQTASAGGGVGALAAPSFNVQVFNATPATWVEITDKHVAPRLRQRLDTMNERSFTKRR